MVLLDWFFYDPLTPNIKSPITTKQHINFSFTEEVQIANWEMGLGKWANMLEPNRTMVPYRGWKEENEDPASSRTVWPGVK